MSEGKWKTLLELGPIALFFAGYLMLRERTVELGGTEYTGFVVITALFVPLIAASTLALWRLTGRVSRMQIVTLVLVALVPLVQALTPAGLAWLVAGGVMYTLGTLFYHRESIPYAHAIWHGFVLAGSSCHFAAVTIELLATR